MCGRFDVTSNPLTVLLMELVEWLERFTVPTAPASRDMEQIHERKPLMPSLEDARSWTDPETGAFDGGGAPL